MKYYIALVVAFLLQGGYTQETVLLTRQSKGCTFGSDVIRNNHKVDKLAWNEDLRNGAEDWAIRCALKQIMEMSGSEYGENLFWTLGQTSTCDHPLYSWYQSIKNYDYSNPKWTTKDGTFIQVIYSTVSKFGIGTTSYKNQVFVVGRFDQPIYYDGPFDLAHVPKPKQNISENELVPNPKPGTQILEVPIPDTDGWTDWVTTKQCLTHGANDSGIEERWCVQLESKEGCEGPRKRNVACSKEIPFH